MEKAKEFIKNNKKELAIFFGGFILAIVIFGGLFIINYSNEKSKEKVEITKEEKSKKESKKKSEIEEMEIVEVDKKEDVETTEENKETTNLLPNEKISVSTTQTGQNNQTTQSNSSTTTSSEAAVISYFKEQESLATGNQNDSSIRDRLKSGVNTIYSFLFEGGTIKGKTFKELSTSAKLQVMKITLSIDQKIDSYFPNYKDKIKQGASNLKAKVVTKYLEETAKICANNENLCTTAREDFQTMKNSYKFTFSLIKDLAKSGSAALKEWYYSVR